MDRIFYAIIFLILLLPIGSKAQIGVNFGSGTASPGQTVDVDITVDDFTNIVLMQLSVNWDSLEFVFDDILNVLSQGERG